MAASVALRQFVGLGDTHRRFCPGQPACNMIDFESKPAESLFAVRRFYPWPTMPSRDNAINRCQAGLPGFRDQLRQALEASKGVVVAVYRPNAFAPRGSQTQNDSIHLFAMYGIDAQGGILLRDSGDRVPITYRIRAGHECEALTIPRAFEVDRARDHYDNWVLSAWIVENRRPILPAPAPSPIPVPAPTPSPFPRPAPPVTDDLPGYAGQDPFDLGTFRLPSTAVVTSRLLFEAIGGSPTRLRLTAGVSVTVATESRQSLLTLERAWGVVRIGSGFTYQPQGTGDPLSDAYRRLGHSDRQRLDALATRFDAAAGRLGKDRRWLAISVMRFVQNIPYELVREDSLGIRTPVEVIGKGGDCDSKSLLAAILLQILGFRTIVLTNDALSHAVLGVDLPASGSYYVVDGVRYALVECTTPSDVGDMGIWGLSGDARVRGWAPHAVEL